MHDWFVHLSYCLLPLPSLLTYLFAQSQYSLVCLLTHSLAPHSSLYQYMQVPCMSHRHIFIQLPSSTLAAVSLFSNWLLATCLGCLLARPWYLLNGGLQGATVLDFAYHVHTDIGNQMIGAKVNGKYVMASHQLANAEIIDILTYDGPLTKNLVARHQVICFPCHACMQAEGCFVAQAMTQLKNCRRQCCMSLVVVAVQCCKCLCGMH